VKQHDELCIRLRDNMGEMEVLEQLEKIEHALLRIVQISINGDARANQPYFVNLANGAGGVGGAIDAIRTSVAQRNALGNGNLVRA
jgi:hypothetical protein